MRTLTVDRIENGIAVCESDDLSIVQIDLSKLPEGIREGSIVTENEDGSFALAVETEKERRKKLFDMQNSLFNK